MEIRKNKINRKSGIYSIIHIDSNRQYIGSAITIEKRFWRHKCDLRRNKHHNHHLQLAWNKYGEKSFLFLVLKYVDDINNLIKEEQVFLDKYSHLTLFNHCFIAGNVLGTKKSDKSKQLMSNIMKGRSKTLQHKANLRIAMQGRVLSKEHKVKISKKLKGRHRSLETRLKISTALRGIKRTEETKQKISKNSSNCSEITRKKLSIAAKNRSVNTLLKMSLAKKGIPLTLEHKQKISNSMKYFKEKQRQQINLNN